MVASFADAYTSVRVLAEPALSCDVTAAEGLLASLCCPVRVACFLLFLLGRVPNTRFTIWTVFQRQIHMHATVLEVFVFTAPSCLAVTCLVSVPPVECRNLDFVRAVFRIVSVFWSPGLKVDTHHASVFLCL